MEFNNASGVGLSDMQHAARAEARRIISASKGDNVRQMKMVLERLEGSNLISAPESSILLKMYQKALDASAGKSSPQKAYFESRQQLNRMLADGSSSSVALTIAAANVSSFDIGEDATGTTTFTAYKVNYAQQGAAIGAGIGSLIGGAAGAVLGGEIGGLIGGVVDECTDDKGKGGGKGKQRANEGV